MLQLVKGKSTGYCSASDHAEAEACPFFIRERHNLYRMLGIYFLLVHRLEDLNPSQYAQGAVEVPTVVDRVDVRSNQNHGASGLRPSRRPNRFPTASSYTERPASSIYEATSS